MEKYGVIDIGSNTMRLVIYKREGEQFHPLLNKKKAAGLAGYVDVTNCMTGAGVDRAVRTLREFQEILEMVEPEQVFVFATASLRNIENTEQVVGEIAKRTGMTVRVLTGEEEAAYDYLGATRALPMESGFVVDIGGGSTELVLFRQRQVLSAVSMKIGSLNLYTRYVREILPEKKELTAITRRVERELAQAMPQGEESQSAALCAIGGTARAVHSLMAAHFGEELGADGSYSVKTLKKLMGLYRKDRREFIRLTLRHAPDRVHTIVPGLAVLEAVADAGGAKRVLTSPWGVREGCLYANLQEGEKR